MESPTGIPVMSDQDRVLYHRVQEPANSQTPSPRPVEISAFQIPRKPLSPTTASKTPFKRPQIVERVGDTSEEEKLSQSARPRSSGWTPFYLRIWVLACFILLFLAIIASLQVLLSISNSHQGIATSRDNLHYLWTYGPTAFFVFVTYFWGQVDYQAKQIQPWSELAAGPVDGSHSLLLDYITPFFPVAFKNALKARHFAIASTIVVSVLIRALTVISTGLMDLEPVRIAGQPADMVLQTVFDGSAFVQQQYLGGQAAYEVLCNLNYNLSFGPGLTGQDAIQLFRPASVVPSSTTTLTATVDVLRTKVTCEVANVTFTTKVGTQFYDYSNITYTTSDCNLPTNISPPPNANSIMSCSINGTDNRVFPWTWTGSCVNLDVSDQNRDRIGFVAYVCEPQGLVVTGSLCLPTYSIQSADVTLDTSSNVLNVAWNTTARSRQLPGIGAIDLVTKTFQQDWSGHSTPIGLRADITELTISRQGSIDQLAVLALNTGPSIDRDTLADPKFLASRMTEVIPRLGSQVANINLLTSDPPIASATVAGLIDREESRLMVRALPIRLMQSICAVNSVLTLLVLLTVKRSVAPPSIQTLGGIATILARSSQVTRILHGSGASTLNSIGAVISKLHFSTRSSNEDNVETFRIEVTTNSEYLTSTWKMPLKIVWEKPLALRWWSILLTSITCAAVLVTLEVLLNQSQKHDGIALVQAESALKYTWLYIPTAVLALISIMFGAISFNLEFAHPYHELARGFSSPNSSLFWNPAGNPSPLTAWRAFRTSRFPLAFSFIAVLFAPLLTIVASSLFTTQDIPNYSNLSLRSQDWFNVSAHIDEDQAIAGLVTQTNMAYPNGTYDELVFPSIISDSMSDRAGNISVLLPALRARLDCHSISDQDIANLTLVNATLQGTITVPENCGYEDPSNYVDIESIFPDLGSDGYFGDFVNFYDSLDLDESLWCATPFFTVYGRASSTSSTGMDHLQAYLCSAGLDVLEANVTFDTLTFSVAEKLTLDESTARNFSSWSNRAMFKGLWQNYGSLNASFAHAYIYLSVAGRDGISAQQLEDPNTFLTQLQHVYKQYAAQVINAVYRNTNARTNVTLLKGVQLNDLQAVYINTDNLRLIQSAVSVRILDGILGLLIICSIVILLTFNGTGVMPKPMGSLAAVASVLADSRIVDESKNLTPPGSEWLDHKQMRKRGLWKNEEFCMKQWDVLGDGEQHALLQSAPDDRPVSINETSRALRAFHIDSRTV